MKNIGVIGCGVVGSAVKQFYNDKGYLVRGYDKDLTKTDVRYIDDLRDCEVLFVSVPTLTMNSGLQDLGPFSDVMANLSRMKFKGIIVHKCTVVPGTTKKFQVQYPKLRIVHCPEFLTEKNAYNDFKNAKAVLLSGHPGDVAIVSDMMDHKVIHTFEEFESTEIAKYLHNCFLATKVSFMNEMFDVCKAFMVDYEPVAQAVSWMGGIGEGHLKVPGPDGKRGWGGMCFPKDTRALINAMSTRGLWMETLAGAMKTNKKVREE